MRRPCIETRVPFLDFRLVDIISRLGFDYKIKEGIAKAPLKRISKQILPETIINRPKIGFAVPINEIFNVPTMQLGFDAWFHFNLMQLGIEAV